MQFELIRWGIAILDKRLGSDKISQLIFVLAIPSRMVPVITIHHLRCLV